MLAMKTEELTDLEKNLPNSAEKVIGGKNLAKKIHHKMQLIEMLNEVLQKTFSRFAERQPAIN